jgi:hypothetical protein
MNVKQQFAFDFYPWTRFLFSLAGHGPEVSSVDITEDTIHVRSGWLFQAEIPCSALFSVERSANPWWNFGGVQTNSIGSWAVGGTYRNVVRLELEPKAKGRLFSLFTISIRRLFISIDNPDGFITAVRK